MIKKSELSAFFHCFSFQCFIPTVANVFNELAMLYQSSRLGGWEAPNIITNFEILRQCILRHTHQGIHWANNTGSAVIPVMVAVA